MQDIDGNVIETTLEKDFSRPDSLRKRADQIDDIIDMFNRGYKLEAIACKYGVSASGIKMVLLKNKERIN